MCMSVLNNANLHQNYMFLTMNALKVENYIKNNQTAMQLVKPHHHCVNAAERAIQTFKNHFISGLCTVNHKFPLQLWCDLLPQA